MSIRTKLSFSWLSTLPPVMVGALVGIALLVPATLVEATLYFRGINALKEEVQRDLAATAVHASTVIDPILHQSFTQPEQESSAEYSRAVEGLARLQEADSRIAFIYTYIVDSEGSVRFVLDPTESGDADNDGVDDKSHVMEPYEDATPLMFESFRSGKAMSETELASDRWGTFLSGYAPVKDADGKTVAVVGVDIDAKSFAARLKEFQLAALFAAIVAVLTSLFIGLGAGLFQKNAFVFRAEQRRAREDLEAFAANLDKVNERLLVANKRFEQLFGMIPVACLTFDTEGQIFEWNRHCEELFGVRAHQVYMRSISDVIFTGENSTRLREVVQNTARGVATKDSEWTDRKPSGEKFTVNVNTFPLVSQDGTVTGGIMACSDITVRVEMQAQIELQMKEIQIAYRQLAQSREDLEYINAALTKANNRLTHVANIDGLTELFTRVYSCGFLDSELANTAGFEIPTSVLMIDIDHFKSLNDKFGHVAGDKVLKAVAKTISEGVRPTDVAGRYGGEEFIVVLPGTNNRDAEQVAERIRNAVYHLAIIEYPVTVSIGTATAQCDTCLGVELISAADSALYEAKRSGRNCVRSANNEKDVA